MSKILIVDDEAAIRSALKEVLEYEGFTISEAPDGETALKMVLKESFDLIFCDIKMPKLDGLDFLSELKKEDIQVPVVMITGHGTIDTAVEAIKRGAYDFIQKPLDLNRVLVSTRNANKHDALVKETKTLKKKLNKVIGSNIIGESKSILEIIKMIDTVAPTDARVLITGGNGCGKELVARQLHEKSNRATQAFIEVNCAAIPSELIESELFGHEKGAFTSAVKTKPGKFELADNGTLFLDEIGDMSLSAQAKVLRALQENKITRVGGEKDMKVNVRILAATNKDLKKEIASGNFREDLYHRLSVIVIKVPSLNERKDDLPLLADHFLQQIADEYGQPKKNINAAALKALQQHDWTGNIREFRNVIERLIILSGETIDEKAVKQYATPYFN
ncbi:MAG: sigma-54 dependent transcriptional regulator [Flavobacteriales bacterium]|jgi:two-component system, NtrC family, nitrogen regulation response regulator NtrX|nr:sigma-54 dependent transcriptional regulator [Flavobacteriales bacterium]MDP4716883.1 sigma-54 dependent transcriptional regulator [Flavobacteriales bacterium]MDP4731119.1 sigma-54 dependent transcriptional regulator [Flavobacteriales bacterium]MDP4818907.1 sigma-54 dependent transcriptional regulator [Flavobacteriales bacterium]MDP4951031.1 sigma-54 dependent transcriptional regulator [Flavobacteriales bacterium]